MRQIVLDTETTGLEVEQGHRIIEVGCVELINRRRTGQTFHRYINPEREIDGAAEQVHGISREMLLSQPKFGEIAAELMGFIDGAELVIHNADFDMGFLDQEFQLAGQGFADLRSRCTVIDSLALARRLHPGQRNGLDALCKRYGVDNSSRDYHGALLDAQLLADVYLAMTGGQAALQLDAAPKVSVEVHHDVLDRQGVQLSVVRASEQELAAHERFLEEISRSCATGALWTRL